MIFRVGQRLRRSNDYRLAGVNAQRVEVLHVAHRYTVIVTVAHNLILYLFPAFQALLNKHLWREGKRFLCQFVEFFFVVAES